MRDRPLGSASVPLAERSSVKVHYQSTLLRYKPLLHPTPSLYSSREIIKSGNTKEVLKGDAITNVFFWKRKRSAFNSISCRNGSNSKSRLGAQFLIAFSVSRPVHFPSNIAVGTDAHRTNLIQSIAPSLVH